MGCDFGYAIVSKGRADKVSVKDYSKPIRKDEVDFRVSRRNNYLSNDNTVYSYEQLADKLSELIDELQDLVLEGSDFSDGYGGHNQPDEIFKDITEAIAVYSLVLKELGRDDRKRAILDYF